MLYIGVADGGNGGDPYKHAQNLKSAFGKILRIDPLGSKSVKGKYGIPANNPFVRQSDGKPLGEIYAYCRRNPQRFSRDKETGNMFMADIGQEVVEKVTLVRPGANQVGTETPRDPNVRYPIVEFDHKDPLFFNAV